MLHGFSISPGWVFRCLVGVGATLVVLSLTVSVLAWPFGHDHLLGLGVKFRLDAEGNIPTYFSAAQMAFAALLLALTASMHRARSDGDTRLWLLLAFGVVAMSVDEVVSLHEMLSIALHDILGIEGPSLFHFSWVIPGLVLVLVVALCFLKFLWRLPRRTCLLFVVSGALFVGGALGMEILGGYYRSTLPETAVFGTAPYFVFELMATLEEALEMLGVALFIYALLDHCQRNFGEVRIRFGAMPAGRGAAAAE